jgi:hypothetical protein
MSEPIKLVIAVPSAGMVRMDFAASLAGLISKLASDCMPTRPECGLEVSIDVAMSSVIHGNRETLAMRALESGKTHMLFIDDDMAFDPRAVDILFGRRQSIVATNYLIKNEARDSFVAVGMDGKRVVTKEDSVGILPISYTGFGLSLFDMEVFRKTPQPWFMPHWVSEKKIYTTEDNPFYARAREAGFTVYLDHDASKMVVHLGGSAWSWKEFKNG